MSGSARTTKVFLQRSRLATLTLAALVLLHLTASSAQTPPSPCAYQEINVDKYGREAFRNPPTTLAQDGSLNTTLGVQFTDPNSTSIAGCPVKLRTYNGQLVGPTRFCRNFHLGPCGLCSLCDPWG